ncbi:unnamed protein product [Prunus armeniaca]
MNSNCPLPWQEWKRKILFVRATTIHVNSGCPSSPLAMAKGKWVELLSLACQSCLRLQERLS